MEAPVTLSHDTLHSVANQLALIVSYANVMMEDIPVADPLHADLAEIRRCAYAAATLLDRPLASSD